MKNGAPSLPITNGDGGHKNGFFNGCQTLTTNKDKSSALVAFTCVPDSYQKPKTKVEDNFSCGILSYRPKWLQKYANRKMFLAVFCLTSVLQGMYYTYFVSVLTTIEKLYQIPSKTTGIIMSATEIGQIGGALILTYYGGHGHRPVWIGMGMIIFGLASIMCSLPHFLFPYKSSSASQDLNNFSLENSALCQTKYLHSNFNESYLDFSNDLNMSFLMHVPSHYFEESTKCHPHLNNANNNSLIILIIFFLSLLFIGIGATAVYTLGIPYIDDNVATKDSPLYFAITIGVRILGPVFGFMLGSLCTSVYINFPFEESPVPYNDPQWMGAWWLGVFIVGVAIIFTSLLMMSFPRKLCNNSSQLKCLKGQTKDKLRRYLTHAEDLQHMKPPLLKDFPKTMKRLFKNKILMLRTASSVLHILPIAGLYTFLPKYLESQFQLTAAKANMISGLAGILVMGFGIMASGLYLRLMKPNARFVSRWIALVTFIYCVGMLSLIGVGCPMQQYVGLNAEGFDNSSTECAASCGCTTGEFAPICSSDGVIYISPCLAGCTSSVKTAEGQIYHNCSCLPGNTTAVSGFCPLECDNLNYYVLLFSIFVLIYASSEVGSMLITLRCVEPKDKAMALGLITFSIGLCGNVPCPIIYGAVVDWACLFWENYCGKAGACRVYDPYKFRVLFHGTTAVIMGCAFLVDLVICYMASSITFDVNEDDEDIGNITKESDEIAPMNTQYAQFESNV